MNEPWFVARTDAESEVPSGLERRMRVRMAEAEEAARLARHMIKTGGHPPEAEERLWRAVRHHDVLAEALSDVLYGEF